MDKSIDGTDKTLETESKPQLPEEIASKESVLVDYFENGKDSPDGQTLYIGKGMLDKHNIFKDLLHNAFDSSSSKEKQEEARRLALEMANERLAFFLDLTLGYYGSDEAIPKAWKEIDRALREIIDFLNKNE